VLSPSALSLIGLMNCGEGVEVVKSKDYVFLLCARIILCLLRRRLAVRGCHETKLYEGSTFSVVDDLILMI
jgi:hypothetical protein